jgi:hypothetical protein
VPEKDLHGAQISGAAVGRARIFETGRVGVSTKVDCAERLLPANRQVPVYLLEIAKIRTYK